MSGDMIFAERKYRKMGGTWMMQPGTLRGFIAVTEESTSAMLDEIERLRAAIDGFVAEVDAHHQPDDERRPLCNWCTGSDGSWPCVHRMALDELKEARREQ